MSDNKNFRNVCIRISASNKIHKANKEHGWKKGDIVNYTIEDIKAILDKWNETRSFEYYLIEHNRDNIDNIHFHMVLCFPKNSQVTFKLLKQKFPLGLIDGCHYSVISCIQYLVHLNDRNKTRYQWSEVVTNVPDRLEVYKASKKLTMETKLRRIIDMIYKGKIKEYEIEKINYDVYLSHKKKIKDAFEYRQLIVANNPNRDILVVVLEGPARTGKSLFCKLYAENHNKSICFSSSSNDPWQEYRGQDIFVYDDYSFNAIKIDDLKKAFDPHNTSSMSARYKNRLFVGDTIFVTTNKPVTEWYRWANKEDRRAIFERIGCVLKFEQVDRDLSLYTVNDIVYSGESDYYTDQFGRVENTYPKMVLKPLEPKPRELRLSEYVDIDSDTNKVNDFISQLDDF